MNLEELKEILRIVDERDFHEFELEREGLRIRVVRHAAGNNHSLGPAPATAAEIPPPELAGSPRASLPAASAEEPAPAEAEEEGLTTVTSPIVGTFYRAPDPNSSPFVNVGDRVSVGQVLCIVEAMKLMNEIEAELVGEVVKIHAENGQPVQYGDPLFTLRRA